MKEDARAIVVLGMHRGGTSVLARSLETFGVFMGDKLLDPNEWNPRGYFEHPDIVALNDKLLGLTGRRWSSLDSPPWEAWAGAAESCQSAALEILQGHFGTQPLWGLKDPRIARLLPFWQAVFARARVKERYVIALRNPLSVARSLAARDGFTPERSYLLWMQHMFAAMRDTEGKPRIVVDYDALIADPRAQLARMGLLVGLPPAATVPGAIADYAGGFLSDALRHSIHDSTDVADDPRAGAVVANAYRTLQRLARDDIDTPEEKRSFRKEFRAWGDFLRDSAPSMRYLDGCEDRLALLTLGRAAEVRARPAADEARASPAPATASEVALPQDARVVVDRARASRAERDDVASPPLERVSVVIPLYNHERYIETAIESVLAQTVRPAEIIVIDDGSSDASAERVRRMCDDHPEIIFWSWPNQGAHHTLNAAIHRATGEFVAILNSDDRYHPERLAHCLKAMREHPAADVVVSEISFIDENGRPMASRWYEDALAFFRETGDWPLALVRANFLMTTSNVFARRSVFEEIGYFLPLRYAHDLEFFLRLILEGRRIHLLSHSLLTYRFHPANTVIESRAGIDVERAAVAAFFLYRSWLREGTSDGWRPRLARFVEVLAQGGIADTVEYFLAWFRGESPGKLPAAQDSAVAEFNRILSRLGVHRGGTASEGSPLTELVEARNAFLLCADAVSEGMSLHVAEVNRLHAVLADKDRALQEQEGEIRRMNGVLSAKEMGLEAQASEVRRLNDALVAKDAAIVEQAAEVKRVNDALVAKDAAIAEQAAEVKRVNDALVAKDAAIVEQAAEVKRVNDALVAKDAALAAQAADVHRLNDALVAKDAALAAQAADLHRLNDVLVAKDAALGEQAAEIHRLEEVLAAREAALDATIRNLTAQLEEQKKAVSDLDERRQALEEALAEAGRVFARWERTPWYKLAQAWDREGFSAHKFASVSYHLLRGITPESLKRPVRPVVARLKAGLQRRGDTASGDVSRDVVAPPEAPAPQRTRVLHVIANFMLGGSSRLVVDLIEGLGDSYEHKVVTSFLPSPPAYIGIDVTEFRSPQVPEDVLPFVREYAPSIVHVHYWGDCDFWWYDILFRAAHAVGCRVIENVNTPVAPYQADFVDRYVYVSKYVQSTFGSGGSRDMIIHPGSDFSLFSRRGNAGLPADCIGMVYRLENDKLNEQSIDVFIKVVQRRPGTRVIIVGGGTFLEPYRGAADAAGVAAGFTFTGYVDYAKLPEVIERMTVFVAPVWKESFGQVGPFAMNMGIPVAGYDVGGVAEIVDDPSLLVAPGNSDELADVVIRLLDDPERCRRIGARNRDRAGALFSRESMVDAYRRVYREVLEAPR